MSSQSHCKYSIVTFFSLLGSLIFWRTALQWASRHRLRSQPRLFPLPHLSFSNWSSDLIKSFWQICGQINFPWAKMLFIFLFGEMSFKICTYISIINKIFLKFHFQILLRYISIIDFHVLTSYSMFLEWHKFFNSY